MIWLGATFLIWLHVLAWGVGLACLITPKPWAPWWPVFVPVVGLTLQTSVVWLGVWANFAGTDTYGGWAEVVPVLLAALAWWRRGGSAAAWRRTAVWHAVGAVVLAATVWPLAVASGALTSLSLGSCDHADYAAGARLMQEFARTDRSGFIGLTEVVELHDVTDLFGHFLRLNHFAPSAIVALNATVTGWAPWQLINVITVVFLAASVPLVAWLARVTLGMRGGSAAVVGLVYGLNPLTWYAVAHGAMSQLLAAQAIALLTVVGVGAARFPQPWRWWRGAGLLGVAFGLIWTAYHFIILVAWMPAAAFALGLVWRRRRGGWLTAWGANLLLPAVATGFVFADRVLGLAARLRLFEEHDFGWKIPATGPAAWLGWVSGSGLQTSPGAMAWVVSALVVATLVGVGIERWWRREAGWAALALMGPAMIGYLFLEWRGAHLGTNASYDAYKLLSVFFPGVLAVMMAGLALRGKAMRCLLVAAFGIVIGLGIGRSMAAYADGWRVAPLRVTSDLVAIKEIERRPEVASINLRLDAMWDRLWANGFLLRKPQYFPVYTYEGRRNTPLRGTWDLRDGWWRTRQPGESWDASNETFSLVQRDGSADIEIVPAVGWFSPERDARTGERWAWSGAAPQLQLINNSGGPRRVRLRLDVRSLVDREVELRADGVVLDRLEVKPERTTVESAAFDLPVTGLEILLTSGAARPSGGGDGRELGLCCYRVELVVDP